MLSNIPLESSWQNRLQGEFDQPYMQQLQTFLGAERQAGKTICPVGRDIFNALNSAPFEQVKVVILGQDPYHGEGQAHGLAFSVPQGVKIPPSLLNIYKEQERDLGLTIPRQGCLQQWAEQGVLLLNAMLTVELGKAASHQKKGWERFTDTVIKHLSDERENLVFLLWGAYAQKKGRVIDKTKHLVLKAPHPSPLSAHRGFIGCGCFSQANGYLNEHGLSTIDWRL